MDIWWRARAGEGEDGGESDRREMRAEVEVSLKGNIAMQTYVRMASTIMVYLAFTWSTVVLLGGFVGSLLKKDFWCLTIITVIHATSIFNELESEVKVMRIGIWNMTGDIPMAVFDSLRPVLARALISWRSAAVAFYAMLVTYMCNILLYFNLCGPIVCICLSSWRLRQRDYNGHGADDGGNLTRGLDFFYTLVLCHGVLYCLLIVLVALQSHHITRFSRLCKFLEGWGWRRMDAYLRDTRERCQQDPAVLASERTSFLSHAVGLLESESQEDYLSSARVLYLLINDGEDARSFILCSRPKIQRLLDMLGWSSGNNTEIRMLSATIVAHLAGGIQLAEFTGAIRCVSSLLETISNQQNELSPTERGYRRARPDPEMYCRRIKRKILGTLTGDRVEQNDNNGKEEEEKVVGCNEMIVQGLRILERLACDPHNRREICAASGLLAKITAPLYSATLIQDVGKNASWADVAGGSLRAVHRLIHATPGRAGRRLRHEISSNTRAVSNLEAILDLAGSEQLRMPAMEILTELVMDPSVNISWKTTENLVRKQLHTFLADGGEDDQVPVVPESTNPIKKKKKKTKTKKKTIKATAGETLSIILSKSEPISRFIVKEHYDIVDRLTARMLDAEYNIRYKTLSAEILENLCTHCKELVDGTLLQKVIEILTEPKTEASERTISALGDNQEIGEISSHGDDVEKQRPKKTGRGKNAHGKASDQQANEDEAELQQALLSLTLVIHEALVTVVQESAAHDAFVDKLKTIVDDNCEETTLVSLRIVKLCCQIVMSRNRYATGDQKKEFLESVSKASKTMGNLESCMLFAGTDSGMEKIARPLLSDLEEKLNKLVA